MEQLPIGGVPPLPPERTPGRPTKAAAEKHARTLHDAVRAGQPQRRRAARQRADRAITLAGDRVARVFGVDWLERACALVLEYGKAVGSAGFIMEDARIYAYGQGLTTPPEERVWGTVTRHLSRPKDAKIARIPGAYGIATSSNNSPKPKWRTL